MIDFSTLQGVAIPEGVVTQIESGGVVLWKQAAKDATVTLTKGKQDAQVYATIGGTQYKFANSFITTTQEFTVPIGTEVVLTAIAYSTTSASIEVNGTVVAEAPKTGSTSVTTPVEYTYVVKGDVLITNEIVINSYRKIIVTD